jgi:hypothetical protein
LGQSLAAQAASRSAQVIDASVVIVGKARIGVALEGARVTDDVAFGADGATGGADGVPVGAMIVCDAQALSTTDSRIINKKRGDENRMTPFYHASSSRYSESGGSFRSGTIKVQ